MKLLSVEPILQYDNHLSFPYIIDVDGRTMICPESNQRSEVALYELEDRCELHSKILDGRFVDTQIAEYDGSYYAFAVELTGKGLEDTRRLKVFKSDHIDGPYSHFCDIDSDHNDRRGAGPIFKMGNRLIRPAQNCEGGYGLGVIFYQVKIMPDKVEETEICRIDADAKVKRGLCFHTFSPCGGLVAVDGLDYPIRFLGKINPFVYKIKDIINKTIRRCR